MHIKRNPFNCARLFLITSLEKITQIYANLGILTADLKTLHQISYLIVAIFHGTSLFPTWPSAPRGFLDGLNAGGLLIPDLQVEALAG